MFIGRNEELADLRAEFATGKPSLDIMYGRRRGGKSTLIQEATKDLSSLYFQATRGLPSDNPRMSKEAAIAAIGDDNILGGMANWPSTLHQLASVADPRNEASLELLGIERCEDVANPVVRRRPVLERAESA